MEYQMAKIVGNPTISLSITFQLDEQEARALDALVGYGDDAFVKAFYEKLGKHYMTPHEIGLRNFFKSVRSQLPGVLSRLDAARKVYYGVKTY
jgi:hypothetical protein